MTSNDAQLQALSTHLGELEQSIGAILEASARQKTMQDEWDRFQESLNRITAIVQASGDTLLAPAGDAIHGFQKAIRDLVAYIKRPTTDRHAYDRAPFDKVSKHAEALRSALTGLSAQ